MLNYIKSECFRVFCSKEIYVITGVLSVLTVLMNLVLFAFSSLTPNFPYGTVRFSLNTLIANMMFLGISGMIISSYMFSDEFKNGTLKNVISFGISRSAFLTGKCIVSFIASFFSMVVVFIFYVGSAYALLVREGDEPLWQLLTGTAACMPVALAGVILTVVLFCRFQREGIVAILWMVIFWGIPSACMLIGLKIEAFANIASWMPWNYLGQEVIANMSEYQCLWNTPEGLAKCIISGFIGIVLFYGAGILLFCKREIA